MKYIFIDIGAHHCETINEVLKENYKFDIIYSFEPYNKNCSIISNKYSDKRLILHNFGFLDKNKKLKFCDAGLEGGTIFKEKKNIKNDNNFIYCNFLDISTWFSYNIDNEDIIFAKLNCEGSEIKILNSLIDSKEIWKINHMYIDFDIKKIKGLEYQAKEMINKLQNIGYNSYVKNRQIGHDSGKNPYEIIGNRMRKWLNNYKVMEKLNK